MTRDEVACFNTNSKHSQGCSKVDSSAHLQRSSIAAGRERAEVRQTTSQAGKRRYAASREELHMGRRRKEKRREISVEDDPARSAARR